MLQIIGYIIFIIITVTSCACAAVAGTTAGIKQNDSMED